MADETLAFETVARLASLIERREVSPVALVEAYLERIDRLNDRVHAYITVCADSALAEARTAEEEIAGGRYRGPLHGIPIGLKDQFYTKGVRTTGGSTIHADLVPDEDATIVARLKGAGAIILGGSPAIPAAAPASPLRRRCVPPPSARIRAAREGFPRRRAASARSARRMAA